MIQLVLRIVGLGLISFLLIRGLSALQGQSIPATAGWYEIPNTKLQTVCPPANFGGQTYDFAAYCGGVVNAWSSAVMDSSRNRLIVWGGGHNDYPGNEFYAGNLNSLTIQRLNNPSIPTNFGGACITALPDGSANSRHTYDGIAYMPNVDRMFLFGGGLTCLAGGVSTDTWTFSFSTLTWQKMDPSGTIPRPTPGIVTAYDPNTGKVFVHDDQYLYSYDYGSNSFTRVGSFYPIDYHLTAVIDPVRKKLVMMGGTQAWMYDIGPRTRYTRQALTTTGGSAIINSASPGLTYDPVSDRIVAWVGGDTVYSLNLDTNSWTPITYSGGPGAGQPNGTFKRWSYSPTSGVFVLVNSMNQNVYAFRSST